MRTSRRGPQAQPTVLLLMALDQGLQRAKSGSTGVLAGQDSHASYAKCPTPCLPAQQPAQPVFCLLAGWQQHAMSGDPSLALADSALTGQHSLSAESVAAVGPEHSGPPALSTADLAGLHGSFAQLGELPVLCSAPICPHELRLRPPLHGMRMPQAMACPVGIAQGSQAGSNSRTRQSRSLLSRTNRKLPVVRRGSEQLSAQGPVRRASVAGVKGLAHSAHVASHSLQAI